MYGNIAHIILWKKGRRMQKKLDYFNLEVNLATSAISLATKLM
jgi:hypothetical protein